MKTIRYMMCAVLVSLTAVGFAQTDKAAGSAAAAIAADGSTTVVSTQAERSFDQLKTLAGSWHGMLDGKAIPMEITMRVTSRGNDLLHEMKSSAMPDDPISMIHLESGRLFMTHFCDAGNEPHMVATTSADGKTITFDFVDATNLLPGQGGHMQHVVFTLIDANHHTELWQFAMDGEKAMGGLMDLTRVK